MSDERPVGEQPPEDVGADTERFRAFVRQGDDLDRREQPSRTFRVVVLAAGLAVLAAVVLLLLLR